ncbi:hypothetical protein EK904_008365 [Melospiza melodia maxima]|nr:hypothetical protein EK904_008365 [Melospiza melodia maxima]
MMFCMIVIWILKATHGHVGGDFWLATNFSRSKRSCCSPAAAPWGAGTRSSPPGSCSARAWSRNINDDFIMTEFHC